MKRPSLMNVMDLGLQGIASVLVFVGLSAICILTTRGYAEWFLQLIEHQVPSRRAALAIVFYLLFIFIPLGTSAFLAGAMWRRREGIWWGIGVGVLCAFSILFVPGVASATPHGGLAIVAIWVMVWSVGGAFVRSKLRGLKRGKSGV